MPLARIGTLYTCDDHLEEGSVDTVSLKGPVFIPNRAILGRFIVMKLQIFRMSDPDFQEAKHQHTIFRATNPSFSRWALKTIRSSPPPRHSCKEYTVGGTWRSFGVLKYSHDSGGSPILSSKEINGKYGGDIDIEVEFIVLVVLLESWAMESGHVVRTLN